MNLWWSWSREARALFRSIDDALWHLTRHNPLELLCRVDPARLAACASDSDFLRRYDDGHGRGMAHEARPAATPGSRTHYPELDGRPVAYFCAEFGLHNSVPIYSGGLGVLAGDHCKAASDLGVPHGRRRAVLHARATSTSGCGWTAGRRTATRSSTSALTPLVPVMGSGRSPCSPRCETSGRPVHVRAWRIMVGRVPIYLLDTNLEANHPDDRGLMNKLYAGGPDLRLRQEWILGVGGVRVLRAMGIDPARVARQRGPRGVHDGRAAAGVRRRRDARSTRRCTRFARRACSPPTRRCPRGTTRFSVDQLEACAGPVWEEMGIDRETLLPAGRASRPCPTSST